MLTLALLITALLFAALTAGTAGANPAHARVRPRSLQCRRKAAMNAAT